MTMTKTVTTTLSRKKRRRRRKMPRKTKGKMMMNMTKRTMEKMIKMRNYHRKSKAPLKNQLPNKIKY
jgi:hypothetical protein